MKKDDYNIETTTPQKESHAKTLINQLLTNTSSLTMITGAQNLADIINLSETKNAKKKRGRKLKLERSKSISVKGSDNAYQNHLDTKNYSNKDRYKLSLGYDSNPTDINRQESSHEIESFVKMPVKKAKNEIIRQPETKENQQLIELGVVVFESDSENMGIKGVDYTNNKNEVCFVRKTTIGSVKRIKKPEGRVFDLLDFIQRRDDKTRLNKVYACKYCTKVYAKRAALGGHTAKNHPHLSDSYKVRQLSMSTRKIERERFDFFKNL